MNWCNGRSRTALTDPAIQHKLTSHADRSSASEEPKRLSLQKTKSGRTGDVGWPNHGTDNCVGVLGRFYAKAPLCKAGPCAFGCDRSSKTTLPAAVVHRADGQHEIQTLLPQAPISRRLGWLNWAVAPAAHRVADDTSRTAGLNWVLSSNQCRSDIKPNCPEL
jgi:hypothetical protein